jgi:glycerate-2-kinase
VKNKELETPKKNNKIFSNVKNSIIGSNYLCIKSIHHFCKDNKIKSKIWFKDIEMDVKKLSLNFYQNLKKQNITKPIVLISGGETTVNIRGNGKGGRNQEFALHFLKIMKARLPKQKYFLLSAGTDGRDGPTDAAGAIINDQTYKILKSNSINLEKELKNNNSYEVLKKLKSLVIINGTNTNVADVQILYVF